MTIRVATAADFEFIQKVLKANGLSPWSPAKFEQASRDCREKTMLIDEGVGFAATGIIQPETDPPVAFSSHLLRLTMPARKAELLRWHLTMIKELLTIAKEKEPKLQVARTPLTAFGAATCFKVEDAKAVPGVFYTEGDARYDFEFDIDKLLAFATTQLSKVKD